MPTCYCGALVGVAQLNPSSNFFSAIRSPSTRVTFDAIQVSLAAGTVARATETKALPFLLQGLLFDSAGNRMTPSHSKKGVRYRYYISQALLQSRKTEAGQVSRVPAPEIEALVEHVVRLRAANPNGDLRSMVEGQVERVTVEADAIMVELGRPACDSEQTASQAGQTVRIPWSKKALTATKGVLGASSTPETFAGHQGVLAAVGQARRWVDDLLAGTTLSEIARREGKGERQLRLLMPLAFLSPQAVKRLVEGKEKVPTVTDLARNVPLVWGAS